MFENLGHFFKKIVKEPQKELGSKDAAKERLHLVLMQDRANVSADFLELMKQEIIDVVKKYIVVDEETIDVRLTNQENEDGTNGAPSLFANIPIVNIKNDMIAEKIKDFEGVDFNKEMGINTYNEVSNKEENKEDLPNVIELPENYDNSPEDINEKVKLNKNVHVDEKNDRQEENVVNNEVGIEEIKEVFEEVDDAEEDDDDVTFDDLLKAAEAAEKMIDNSEKTNTKNTKDKTNKKK